MLKINKVSNGRIVFSLSGRVGEEHVGELKALIDSETEGTRIILDLTDLTLAGHEVISLLERYESSGIELRNCPPYIREWINRHRVGG
ncbi:hypothetical protein ACPOL_4806 [Acidisarcina polymorpha]|uniref:STAS domain-containing protein n=1 Tax=Acidisarcina polymorpha TaxID=2211140 RepID=A0A2Z5G4J6_9BACT|nr:hypothetical protein [Acidisarcina polymorpha]AXC14072.1 hypothetical protein ACPOL_4806 [Acidisarcina polymorpha]